MDKRPWMCVDDVCRICLVGITSNSDCIYTSESREELSDTGILYEDLFSLLVSNEEDLPAYICNYCSLQLKLFFNFKLKAIESYGKLKETHVKIDNRSEYVYKICLEVNEETGKHTEKLKIGNDIEVSNLDSSESRNVIQHEAYELEKLDNNELMFVPNVEKKSTNEKIKNKEEEEFEEIQYLDEEITEKTEFEYEIETETYTPLDNSDNSLENENDNQTKTKKDTDEEDSYNIEFTVFVCNHCDKSFETKRALSTHKSKEHGRVKLSCSQCEKKFFSKEGLETHLRVHSGLPAYECPECPRTFSQKAHYVYHMKGHRNERNVQCHLCGKGFKSNSDLKIHMRVHSDERRYECDICGRRFRANTHLKNHQYSHYDEKVECEICHHKYSCPNVLRTHIKAVHLRELPYQCTYCSKRFNRKHHLKSHYNTHQKKEKQYG